MCFKSQWIYDMFDWFNITIIIFNVCLLLKTYKKKAETLWHMCRINWKKFQLSFKWKLSNFSGLFHWLPTWTGLAITSKTLFTITFIWSHCIDTLGFLMTNTIKWYTFTFVCIWNCVLYRYLLPDQKAPELYQLK